MNADPFASILSTKFYIPAVRADGVPRPRLTQVLLAGLQRPRSLVMISGPAGFGKTTLLAELAAQAPGKLAWLTLDESDNDPVRFWSNVVAACRVLQPEIGSAALRRLTSPPQPTDDAIPTALINDIATQKQAFVLVLDDFHVIQNPGLHAGAAFLFDNLPDNLHPVIATRIAPLWPLARWRARNQLVEIRAADLRFTPDETRRFLHQAAGLDLTSEDLTALEKRTEGWAAGLQLAALSLRDRGNVGAFLHDFSGSNVYVAEYLVEEVLQRQTDAVQAFLLQTAILERLNAGLCRAVTGTAESGEMLANLQRANLFLLPLDDAGRWFRYHALFADLLRARLHLRFPAQEIAELHRRAAGWYAAAGLAADAVAHALAGEDDELAAQLVEQAALPTILQAHIRTVEGWLNALPA